MFLTVCLNPTLQKTLCFSKIVPGTVNRTAEHRLDASGKGVNVTRVLSQLGKKALHLTQLGPEPSEGGSLRPLFLSLCEKDGLSVEWVESGSQIRFCYTLLTDYDGLTAGQTTELVEESEPVAAETEQRLLQKYDYLLGDASLGLKSLIISGTKAAGFSDSLFPDMVKKAKEKGIKTFLDIRGKDLIDSLKHEPDVIKPNLFEFAGTFAPELIKDNDLKAGSGALKTKIKPIAAEIAQKYRCTIILTNGSRKIFAADGENFFEAAVNPVQALNSIGCGDAFTAGLAAALTEGADLNAAISEGSRCGALCASLVRPGVIF